MALVKCPDCGRDVSDKAPSCPNCGRPMLPAPPPPMGVLPPAQLAKPKSVHVSGRLGCLIVLAVLVGAIVFSSIGDDSPSPSAPQTVDLTGRVRFTGTQFIISNVDTFSWTNCTFEINPKTFSSGYKYAAGTLAPGTVATVGALQFANSDGQRFNPFSLKPTSVSVSCDTPGGRGYYFGSWQ